MGGKNTSPLEGHSVTETWLEVVFDGGLDLSSRTLSFGWGLGCAMTWLLRRETIVWE